MISHRVIVLVDGIWKIALRIGVGDNGTLIYELNGKRGTAERYTWAPVSDRLNDRGAEEMVIKYNLESIQPKVKERPRRPPNDLAFMPDEDGQCNCAFCRGMREEQ